MSLTRRRGRLFRRSGSRLGDEAHTHVLEAVIIATIMISAVAFVVTFDQPPAPTTASRDILQQKSEDALNILYDTPVLGSNFGDNALSVYLVECMQGNCTNLTAKLDKLVPVGASYALYVSNGYDTYPVYVIREPAGEAVTATRLLEPKWSNSFVSTARNNINPATDPLLVYSLPVFNANPLSQGGSSLRVLAHGTRLSDGSNYTLMTSASTQAVTPADALLYPAVSLNWLVPVRSPDDETIVVAWVPGGYGEWYWETIDTTTGYPTLDPVPFTLEINETQGVLVPVGTEITVHVPRGWNASADQAVNAAYWTVLENATDANSSYTGSDVRARLHTAFSGSAVRFTLNATYQGDVLNTYTWRATLSKGALAQAELFAFADGWPDETQTLRAPSVLLSAPRPMGASATTTWTLSFDAPRVATANVNLKAASLEGLDRTIEFHTIEIVEQEGRKIFADVHGVGWSSYSTYGPAHKGHTNLTNGTWTSEGDRLVWTGSMLSDDGPHSLTFQVNASGVGSPTDAKNPFVPPVQFDSYKGRLVHQASQGLYKGVFLPENATTYYDVAFDGYERIGDNGTMHDFVSDPLHRVTRLRGESNYTIETVPTVADALYGSYVNVETPVVPVGGQVVISADVQSMLFALADAGQSAGVKLRFYPPWAGDTRSPIYEQPNLDTGLLNSQVTALAVADVNDDGFADPILGTSNGRVIAVDALSGARLQGRVFAASVSDDAPVNGSAAAITHLAPMTIGGETYVAVGTDEQSGIYVLDAGLKKAWEWPKAPYETVAMDASVDVSGDGRADVVVTLRDPSDSTSTYLVYVLRAQANTTMLLPHLPVTPVTGFSEAFYSGTGTPGALAGMSGIGPTGDVPGLAVSIRTLPGQKSFTTVSRGDPLDLFESQITIETPRHGLVGVDRNGTASYNFFGSPISVIVPTDHDGDPATDLIAGSPNGFVYMLNGTVAAQPIYSTIFPTMLMLEDADCQGYTCVMLSSDGDVVHTRDGWGTYRSVVENEGGFVTSEAIALNNSNSYWMAGILNGLWRSQVVEGKVSVSVFDPVFPAATKDGLPYSFNASPHSFYDVTFRRGTEADVGWVVGGGVFAPTDAPCTLAPICPESLIMRTTTGGANWTVLSHASGTLVGLAGPLDAPLTRINFTTKDVGWAVGTEGVLVRTLDGGSVWRQVSVPTTAALRDISCSPTDPDLCVLVGAGSVALRTRNATATYPGWTNISAHLGDSAQDRSLYSVGVVSEDRMFIGASNMVLMSLDGAENWTTLPMNYLENDGMRITTNPDGTGWIFGGNSTNSRLFQLHDFVPEGEAYSSSLTAGLAPGIEVLSMNVTTRSYGAPGTSAVLEVTANGGANWETMTPMGTGTVAHQEHGAVDPVLESYWEWDFPAVYRGNDARFRIDLATGATQTHNSPHVKALDVNVTYVDVDGATKTRYVHVDPAQTTYLDATLTTAGWDTAARSIHLKMALDLWSRNVSGEVLDVVTGHDVVGDEHDDVWVATGGVYSGNSPDHLIYASAEDVLVGADNRIYLLDGANGSIVARSSQFGGSVQRIAVSDQDADGKPEHVFAIVGVGTSGYLYGLGPTNLTILWNKSLGSALPNSLEVTKYLTGNATAVISTVPAASTSGALPSRIWDVWSTDGSTNWTTLPDDRGRYIITTDVPMNWFFGPYVVEIVVEWTDTVTRGNASEVLQSARFYDYFTVTPPDLRMPPTPVYNVQLVTWFNDWR